MILSVLPGLALIASSVAVRPGATQLTRTPSGASAAPMCRVKELSADLEVAYSMAVGRGCVVAAIDEIFTMRP